MASVKPIAEDEATGRSKPSTNEIEADLGTDFVPNVYKAIASNPGYLEANWAQGQGGHGESKRLDPLTKEIIAVAVSAVNTCHY